MHYIKSRQGSVQDRSGIGGHRVEPIASGGNGSSSSNRPGNQGPVPATTCYGCGKPGHKRPQCPDRVR